MKAQTMPQLPKEIIQKILFPDIPAEKKCNNGQINLRINSFQHFMEHQNYNFVICTHADATVQPVYELKYTFYTSLILDTCLTLHCYI